MNIQNGELIDISSRFLYFLINSIDENRDAYGLIYFPNEYSSSLHQLLRYNDMQIQGYAGKLHISLLEDEIFRKLKGQHEG